MRELRLAPDQDLHVTSVKTIILLLRCGFTVHKLGNPQLAGPGHRHLLASEVTSKVMRLYNVTELV